MGSNHAPSAFHLSITPILRAVFGFMLTINFTAGFRPSLQKSAALHINKPPLRKIKTANPWIVTQREQTACRSNASNNQKTLEEGVHVSEQIIKKSRFIGIAHHCRTWNDAQESIAKIRSEHPKSRHVCFAMVAGMTERSSDDGEPTGTGGLPILNALRGEALSDTLCVVVRYYGGIKLGAGGLIRAYGGTARQVLQTAPTKVLIPQSTIHVSCTSTHVGSIYDLASKFGASIQNEVYLSDGTLNAWIVCETRVQSKLKECLQDATQGKIEFLPLEFDDNDND